MVGEEVRLPEGAVHLATLGADGVTVSLCDIGGVCWLYGLESAANHPSVVLSLIRRCEETAKRHGYESIMTESSNKRLLNVVGRWGYREVSTVLEKTL